MFEYNAVQKQTYLEIIKVRDWSVYLPGIIQYMPVYSLRCDRGTEQVEHS